MIAGLAAPSAQAACIDHAIWDGILKANVDPNGFVDYDSIRVNKGGDLYQYISFLEDADLKSCSQAEKLAFWINAYNAHMIRQVLARPKMQNVSEDFKLFHEKFKIARLNLSLNSIENRVLRSDPKQGGPIEGVSLPLDPRVHFALNCGAISCPKLVNRAYQPQTLAERLQANAVNFANAPKHLRVENGALVASSILKWYGSDFDKLGGVPAYLSSLTDPKLRADEKDVDAKLPADFPQKTTFEYDWTLNSIKNKK